MTNIDPAIVEALADALHADTDICGGGCTQTAQRLAPALGPAVDAALTAAMAERDAARAEVARLRAAVEGIHHPSGVGDWCRYDGEPWPCRTARAMTEVAP